MARSIVATLLLFAALTSCGDTLEPFFRLDQPRTISAVAQVNGAPERATPRPGEVVTVTLGLAAPGEVEPASWTFIVCPPATDQAFGVPSCGGAPLAMLSSLSPSSDPIALEIAVPPDYAFESLALLGSVCIGGEVELSLDLEGDTDQACAGEGFGQLVVGEVRVEQTPALANRNPAFASVSIDDLELSERSLTAREPCADGELPTVRLDDEVRLAITAAPGSRENFVDPRTEMPRAELLTNELFVTEGEPDGRFILIEDPSLRGEADYLAELDEDDPLPAEGRTVVLIVVMRDRRGGQAEFRTGFCLVP